MKKLMMFAIPALLLTFTIIKIAYSWSAYAGAGYTDSGNMPRTYADAYASNYGLRDGHWWANTKIGNNLVPLGGKYVGTGVLTNHQMKKNANVWAWASSSVDGVRTIVNSDGEEIEVDEEAGAQDTHHP